MIVKPRGATTGAYRFVVHMVRENPIVAAAALGDEVSVEITTPGQSATVTFEASAGEDLTIKSITITGLGDVVLLAPSGAVVAEFFSFEDFGPVPAPESGTYQLILDPRGDIFGTQTWKL